MWELKAMPIMSPLGLSSFHGFFCPKENFQILSLSGQDRNPVPGFLRLCPMGCPLTHSCPAPEG